MTAIPRDRHVQIDRDADGPGPIRSRTRSPHSSFGVYVVRREVAVVTVPPMRRPVEKQMDGFLTGHVGGLGQNGHMAGKGWPRDRSTGPGGGAVARHQLTENIKG
jgi:hypothetical protein